MIGSGRILAGMLVLSCGLAGPAAAEDPRVAPPPAPVRAFDVGAIPFLSAAQRPGAARYAEQPPPKALAISPAGDYAYVGNSTKTRTAEDVRRSALQRCQFLHRGPCALYAVDDTVLLPSGAAFTPMPVEIPGGGPFDPAKVPFVSDQSRADGMVNYQRGRGHKALVVTPGGAWAAVWDKPTEAEARKGALQRCKDQDAKANCLVYAVGDTVVFDEER